MATFRFFNVRRKVQRGLPCIQYIQLLIGSVFPTQAREREEWKETLVKRK